MALKRKRLVCEPSAVPVEGGNVYRLDRACDLQGPPVPRAGIEQELRQLLVLARFQLGDDEVGRILADELEALLSRPKAEVLRMV